MSTIEHLVANRWVQLLLGVIVVAAVLFIGYCLVHYYATLRVPIETENFGDSLSSEDPTDYGIALRLPSWRQRLFRALDPSLYTNAGNFAHAGHTFADQQRYIAAFERTPGKKESIAFLWLGINDLGQGATATQVEDSFKATIATLRAKSVQVIAATLTAYDANFYRKKSTVDGVNIERLAFNNWLRENYQDIGVSVLVDLASDPRIGPVGAGLDRRYFKDRLHMTFAGRQVAADMFARGLAQYHRGSGMITAIEPTSEVA